MRNIGSPSLLALSGGPNWTQLPMARDYGPEWMEWNVTAVILLRWWMVGDVVAFAHGVGSL